jgi:hypothetical protein
MHGKSFGWSLLILGILFLLVDLGYWTFWGIQWWTALFVVWGVISLTCKGYCNTPRKK